MCCRRSKRTHKRSWAWDLEICKFIDGKIRLYLLSPSFPWPSKSFITRTLFWPESFADLRSSDPSSVVRRLFRRIADKTAPTRRKDSFRERTVQISVYSKLNHVSHRVKSNERRRQSYKRYSITYIPHALFYLFTCAREFLAVLAFIFAQRARISSRPYSPKLSFLNCGELDVLRDEIALRDWWVRLCAYTVFVFTPPPHFQPLSLFFQSPFLLCDHTCASDQIYVYASVGVRARSVDEALCYWSKVKQIAVAAVERLENRFYRTAPDNAVAVPLPVSRSSIYRIKFSCGQSKTAILRVLWYNLHEYDLF